MNVSNLVGSSGSEPLVVIDDTILEILPTAVYVCSRDGTIVRYNRKAVELWGRSPKPGDTDERFCGSHRLFWPDGRPLPHAACPMAEVLRTGIPARDLEVVIEQPSGDRLWAQVNVEPIRNERGEVTGAINCFQDITARKQLEFQLRAAHDEFEDVFTNGAVGLHLVAADGTILRANQAELDLLGYTAQEYIGRHIGQFHVDQGVLHDILTRLLRGERLDSYPARLRAKDGSTKHVLITSSGRFCDGEFRNTRCFTIDVTDQHLADEALRESERRTRVLLDALPAAVYTTDAAGCITYYNQAAAEFAGHRPQTGDKWCVTWRLYRPDGTPLPHDECPMAVALKENRAVWGQEAVAERPDGTRVPFMPFPTPLHDASGALVGAVNVLVDISEHKRAEAAVQRLASIVESSSDAIASQDMDGVIRSWNQGAERLFGYGADEIIGKPVTHLIPPERLAEETAAFARICRGERVEPYETVRRRKDGTLVDVSVAVSPVKNGDGTVVGSSRIARDISERMRVQARQTLLIHELNHRVKNTLAIVQSVAAQSFRTEAEREFYARFETRLISLARAHDILTRENWEGADLQAIVKEATSPHCAEPARFEVEGAYVRVSPTMALSIAMALQELCTNAAKYGALSKATGKVTIRWHLITDRDGRRLCMRWEERGGPPVVPPQRTGFGSRLIKRGLARELDANIRLDYEPGGVVCTVEAPLR